MHVGLSGALLQLASLLVGCGVGDDVSVPVHSTGQFGEPGLAPGQLAYPRVLESSTHNGVTDLWIIDKAGRIQWFVEGDARPRALWKTPKHDIGMPTGMAVHYDEQGPLLFIADTHEHRVLVQRPPKAMGENATTVASFGGYGYGTGEMIYPCDVELLIGSDGRIERIYVAEYGGNDRVSVYSPDYEPLFSFGSFGNPWDGEGVVFNRPQSVAIDARAGVVYVADAINHRVGRFTLEGALLGWLGGGGPSAALGSFKFPYSLAVLEDGTLLVCEYGNSRVQRVEPSSGDVVGIFGSAGRGPGQMINPWSLALTPKHLWVLDSGNARVLAFDRPSLIRTGRDSGGQVAGR